MATLRSNNSIEKVRADAAIHNKPVQPNEALKKQALNLDPNSLHHVKQNHLLAALPLADLATLTPYLQLVQLPVGKMLFEPNEHLRFAYFPTSCLVSLQHELESGRTSETAGVGNEGMVGIAIFMGGDSTPSSAVVQMTGYAYQIESQVLLQAFKNNVVLQDLLLRYTQVLLTQISLTAVCNRHHSLQQQFCRWLLLALDRLPSNEITMTQDLVAGMLGVRREGITEAAGYLQSVGIISYRRGHIKVISRTGLETNVCECYGVVKKELSRLLPNAN